MRPVLIGIAGGSGSGKTTLATALCEQFADATLIAHDSYYHDLSHLDGEVRAGRNFDHPAALDTDLLARHLGALRRRSVVDVPVYDFTSHCRTGEHRPVGPAPVIVIDGVLLYTHPGVVASLDYRLFVEVDAPTRLTRRLERDVTQRGRTAESVRVQFERTVEPMHRAFVEPSSVHADRVVTPADDFADICESVHAVVRSVRTDSEDGDDSVGTRPLTSSPTGPRAAR